MTPQAWELVRILSLVISPLTIVSIVRGPLLVYYTLHAVTEPELWSLLDPGSHVGMKTGCAPLSVGVLGHPATFFGFKGP